MFDLIVKNATLPDGRTGMDIACAKGQIVAVEPGITGEAAKTIDAEGYLLSPPFVDPHFHMDATLSLGTPRMNVSGTLLEGIGLETLPAGQEAAEDLAQGPLIWAHQPSGDLGALLRAAGPVDQARAATSRSYWWAPPRANGMPAMWLGHTGLPDAHALGWLLSGNLGQQSPQADRGVMHAPQ